MQFARASAPSKMIDDVIEQLNEGLEDFLHLWEWYLRQAGDYESTLSRRDDSVKAFHALLSAMQKMKPPKSSPTPLFFVQSAREQKARGGTAEMCIACIKAMRCSLEDLIEAMIIADGIKLKALHLLRRHVDVIETAIITDWENTAKDQITRDLQRANQQLTKEKSTYENIFKATSNLVLITDRTGTIVEANPEATVFFSGQKVLGRFCGDLLNLPGQPLDNLLKQVAPNELHEVTLTRGSFEQVFNLQILPLTAALPSQGVMLLLSDITCMVDHRQMLEQCVAERTRALAKSEKMLDAIFQSVGKGILLIDKDREVVKANQQASEIYGIPLEVLIGTPFCTLTDHAGCLKLNEICDTLIEGQSRNAEITSLYVNGQTFPSEISMTRMDLEGQKFWPVIVRDITEQRALENGLREEKLQTEEMNVTLKNVLKTIESDRREAEQNLAHRVRSSLLPGIEKIRKEKDEGVRSSYLDLLREQLVSLTAGFETELDADLLKLSKTELKICRFVKAGLTGKEICEAMNLSFETIQTHRKNIRKKLGLSGKNVNLHTFLASRSCDLGG